MADFNPDKFLNETAPAGVAAPKPFDADAFLAATAPAPDEKAAAAPTEAPAAGAPKIVEAQHPAVDNVDRFAVQNLASSPEQGAAYLAKRYPDLDVKVYQEASNVPPSAPPDPGAAPPVSGSAPPPSDGSNVGTDGQITHEGGARILLRHKSAGPEDPWMPIEPHGFADPTEVAKAVAGRAYPALAGAGTGLMTTAGGLAGAAIPVPGAALALGAANGGMFAAGAEALRQTLGEHVLNGGDVTTAKPDWDQIRNAGTAGLVSPLLFGTGATMADATAAGVPYASQQGLPMQAMGKATLTASSLASGIPKATIARAKSLVPEMQAVEAQGAEGVRGVVKATMDSTRESLMQHQQRLGAEIADTLAKAGQPVDITAAKAPLKSYIAELENLKPSEMNEARKAELANAKAEYQRIFMVPQTKEVPVAGTGNSYLGRAPETQKVTTMAEMPNKVDGPAAMRIKRDLQDLGNLTTKGAGTDTYNYMSNTAKTMQAKARDAGSRLGEAIDSATANVKTSQGQGVGSLNAKYKQLKDVQDVVGPLMDEGSAAQEQTLKFLKGLGNPANPLRRNTFSLLDKEYGTNVVHNADLLNSMSLFAPEKLMAESGFGSTSTSKTNTAKSIGRAVGGLLAGGAAHLMGGDLVHAGAIGSAGGAVGGAVGGAALSPAALRKYMESGIMGRKGIDALTPAMLPQIGTQIGVSPWQSMNK